MDFNFILKQPAFVMDFNFILKQPAFVIHINELAPERKDFFTKNITEAGYNNMQIFEGVNLSKNKIGEEYANIKWDNYMSNGTKGCLLSHIMLYKYIISNNIQICTIFEDDIHFHPDYKILAPKYYNNTPKNFEIIFIGNQIDECCNINNILPINKCSHFCSHAYIITINAAKKLLNYILTWDYWTKENQLYVGRTEPLLGLFPIDIIIKNIQDRIIKKTLKANTLIWYCWNGTKFQCDYNKYPLTRMFMRNTGLVFQSPNFPSIIGNNNSYPQ
jgi:GR25 family glycosyltransferase involved in LPS biosynthesis